MKSIVGYSGFVGSNLILQTNFDYMYNSKNINSAYNTSPDLLVYSGIRGEKYLANNEPEKDYNHIQEAIKNIKLIKPKTIILISTIDVYKNCSNVDEDSDIETKNHFAYGRNRYLIEDWVEKHYENHLIVRLPAIYSENLKKNFIYDLINLIPPMLPQQKFLKLSKIDNKIDFYFTKQENGYYKCKNLINSEKNKLKIYFNKMGFNSLNFTDSRSRFEFYNLIHLWKHIEISLKNGLNKINLVTEPVEVSELYHYIKNSTFTNEITINPPNYNCRTKYYSIFSGKNGYIFNKDFVLEDLKMFVEGQI